MANKASKILLQMQKKWKSSEARAKNESVPDGQYQARIISASIDRSKAGRLQTILKFKIESGKHKGRFVWKYDGLETPDNISWLKSTLRTMEVKVPNKIVNLEKALEKLEDEMCIIQVKTSGQFTNTYIQKKIEDISEDDGGLEDDVDDVDNDDDDDVDEKPKKKGGKKTKKKKFKKEGVDEEDTVDSVNEDLEDSDDDDDDDDDDDNDEDEDE